MRVSVIIPTFNSAQTIDDTLRSIMSQDWQDMEIIVQDGGSLDDTKSIVEKYPIAMSGWQSEPDQGLYDAMNKGISRATGEVVAILNSDDTWLPNTLEQVVSVFSRNPDIGIVSGSIEVWEDLPNGAEVMLKSSLVHLHQGLTIQHPATFVRRSVYHCMGFFNTRYRIGADYDFILRCVQANIPLVIIDTVLTRMRAGGKGSSSFSVDDWRIRRSHKLSSPAGEIIACATSFARYVVRQFLIRVFGKKFLSTLRGYSWNKRIYR